MRTAQKSGDHLCALDLRYHAKRYGVETILAMDDEPEVLALATSIMQAESHTRARLPARRQDLPSPGASRGEAPSAVNIPRE